MDVCVVTFRNTADRIRPAVRATDRLWIRDNTIDNIGFAAAANELARRGSAELIAFVNPDGCPQPGCLDILEAAFSDPEVVAAEPSQGDAWVGRSSPGRLLWVSGACMVVRRSAFERVGGFDESLWMYGEDVDLSLRLAELGRLAHCWDAVFLHDRGKRSFRAERLQARNQLILHRRHGFGAGNVMALRGVLSALRHGEPSLAVARLVGVVEFLTRAGRFSRPTPRDAGRVA